MCINRYVIITRRYYIKTIGRYISNRITSQTEILFIIQNRLFDVFFPMGILFFYNIYSYILYSYISLGIFLYRVFFHRTATTKNNTRGK